MTKSLTSSIQQAVNTVRDLTLLDATVPYIASVLEQPISLLSRSELVDSEPVASAEECFELPPIQRLPGDIADNVLESIINEFKVSLVQSSIYHGHHWPCHNSWSSVFYTCLEKSRGIADNSCQNKRHCKVLWDLSSTVQCIATLLQEGYP